MGVFYYQYEDLDLALKCFKRAQIVDPEYHNSWLLDGILSEYLGQENYPQLLGHAWDLGTWHRIEILYNFARVNLKNREDSELVRQAIFSIQKCAELKVPIAAVCNLYGLYLEKESIFSEAVVQYEKALQFASPELAMVIQENLARSFCSNQMFNKSVVTYQGFIEKSHDVMEWAGYGTALFFNQDYMTAFSALEKALELASHRRSTDFGFVAVLISQVLFAMGEPEHFEKAKQILQQRYYILISINADPNYIPAQITLAMLSMLVYDSDLIRKSASFLLSYPPNKCGKYLDDMNFVLSRMFLLQADIKTATNFASKAVLRYPTNYSLWIEMADLLCRLGKSKSGVRCLNPADYSGLNYCEASSVLGSSNLKNRVASKRNFSRAVLMNPHNAKNWLGLAISCEKPAIVQKVLLSAECTNLSTLFAPWISIYFTLYKLREIQHPEECGQFIEMLDSIASEAPFARQKQAAYLVLSQYLFYLGDIVNATESIKQGIASCQNNELSGEDFGIFAQLCHSYLEAGNLNAATKCIDKLSESNSSCALLESAIHYLRINDIDRAESMVRKALLKTPNSLPAKYIRAVIDKKRNKPAKFLDQIKNSTLEPALINWIVV